jgi:hypothetical protein
VLVEVREVPEALIPVYALAFGASLDDGGLSLDHMRASANPASGVIFGAFDGGALVPVVGVIRTDREDATPRDGVGDVRDAGGARQESGCGAAARGGRAARARVGGLSRYRTPRRQAAA